MNTVKPIRTWLLAGIFCAAIIISCKPLMSLYDQYAYTQATSLKVDLQNLAGESGSIAYRDANADIARVNIELQKANEYAKGRSQNSLSAKQYSLLLSDAGFYKSFLKTWKANGKESQTAADEISLKIGQLMDQVIALENGKNKF